MKIQIDLKSAAFGLIVGVIAIFALGDVVQPSDGGHYQISLVSGAAGRAAVIIDTRTGQAWSARTDYTMNKDDGDAFWSPKNQ